MPSNRDPLRLVRGGVAATIATAVALFGHVAGGGAVPGWLGVALPWWLSVTACTVLAGSRFSLPRLSVAVLGSQALFHGLFMAGTPGDPHIRLVDPPGSHLGHGAHGAPGPAGTEAGAHAAHGTEGLSTAADPALHAVHSEPQMLIGHAVAALVTTLLLHRGETMLFRCFGLAGALLRFLRHPRSGVMLTRFVIPRPRPALPSTAHLRIVRRAVLSPQLRRGPPLTLAA